MTEEDFKNVIDNGSRVILAMSEELEKMKVKYGTGSQFVKTKEFHLNCLVEMQDALVNEINILTELIEKQNNAIKLSVVNSKMQEFAMDLMAESFANQIHTEKLVKEYLPLLEP